MSNEVHSLLKNNPNQEQLKAICTKRGVMLKAGAGSGKTFVIVEHLFQKMIDFKRSYRGSSFEVDLATFLSKIVLMTFTNKAAGEMRVRIARKIENLISIEDDMGDRDFYKLIFKHQSLINILTIHGLCLKLISLKLSKDMPATFNIASKEEVELKVFKLADEWFDLNINKLSDIELAYFPKFKMAMVEIFNSAELRLLWHGSSLSEISIESLLENFFVKFNELEFVSPLLCEDIVFTSLKPQNISSRFIENFAQLKKKVNISKINREGYELLLQMFEEFKRSPTAPTNLSDYEREYFNELKNLRSVVLEVSEVIKSFQEDFEGFSIWQNTLKDLFQYIENKYLAINVFSFADLEYYAHVLMQNEIIAKKIQDEFDYLIVDEFQDTSEIQFQIIKKIVADDFSRLFCVGDVKQAIYGFRGGELGVFNDAEKRYGQDFVLRLQNNYRSLSVLIDFNNKFFKKIINTSEGYKPVLDKEKIVVDMQKYPHIAQGYQGEVFQIIYDSPVKPKAEEIEFIEAQMIMDEITKSLDSFNSIAILYSRLKPSKQLIKLLEDQCIPFRAQVKNNIESDFLSILFKQLLKLSINSTDEIKYKTHYQLIELSLKKMMGLSLSNVAIEEFFLNEKLWGLSIAFKQFLFSVGINVLNYRMNYAFIEEQIKLNRDDKIELIKRLENKKENVSYEYVFGDGGKIQIMSVHASKGLEFDLVIMGGVTSNGKTRGSSDIVGNFPFSFKWKVKSSQKTYLKSPFLFLEEKFRRMKNSSENKRLYYVACTRAAKKLVFPLIKFDGEIFFSGDDSWSNGISQFLGEFDFVVEEYKLVERAKAQSNIPELFRQNKNFHHVDSNRRLIISSELSVTRLSTLFQCPFKFYLESICKINVQDLPSHSLLDVSKVTSESDLDIENEFFSSKKRGTDIHSFLERYVKNGMYKSTRVKSVDEVKAIETLKLFLIDKSLVQLEAEKVIKFTLESLGQMVSGKIDLFAIDSLTSNVHLIDYKTGSRKVEDEEHYWAQLELYALSFFQRNEPHLSKVVHLHLIYLDQGQVISKEVDVIKLRMREQSMIIQMQKLSEKNRQHCAQCDFKSICR